MADHSTQAKRRVAIAHWEQVLPLRGGMLLHTGSYTCVHRGEKKKDPEGKRTPPSYPKGLALSLKVQV